MKFFVLSMLFFSSLSYAAGVEEAPNAAIIKQALADALRESTAVECGATLGTTTLTKTNAISGFINVTTATAYKVSLDESNSEMKILFTYSDSVSAFYNHYEYTYVLSSDEQDVTKVIFTKTNRGYKNKNVGTISNPKYENVPFNNKVESYECTLRNMNESGGW